MNKKYTTRQFSASTKLNDGLFHPKIGIVPGSSGSPPVCGLIGGAGSWVTLLILFCEHTCKIFKHVSDVATYVCVQLNAYPF